MEDSYRPIVARKFGKERVPVDGCVFEECVFDGTTLVFAGTAKFVLTGCSGSMEMVFIGAAARVVEQLGELHLYGYASFVEPVLARIRNPTGEVGH